MDTKELSRDKKEIYIEENIAELQIVQLRNILQRISDTIPASKIMEKGDGTYIKFSDLPDELIEYIYNYVKSKIDNLVIDITSSDDDSDNEKQDGTFEL